MLGASIFGLEIANKLHLLYGEPRTFVNVSGNIRRAIYRGAPFTVIIGNNSIFNASCRLKIYPDWQATKLSDDILLSCGHILINGFFHRVNIIQDSIREHW